ncbi:pyridoxamine 5'-phosphate oxidase family protein [Candidatus Bathyarchaeota archaeon]|nr:MAG: pyridoxamine 5'-phosphate oxidase family protein [Candidatus Bathyarchaeota archaeon]
MRRKDKEIKEWVVIEEVLRENQVGRLGTAVGGEPYVVPVNYVYTGGRIYIHSHREGKKVRDILENPRVCFEVDSGEIIPADRACDYSWEYKSVIAFGVARLVEDEGERVRALRMLVDKYGFGKGSQVTAELLSSYPQLAVIRVDVERATGKQSPAPSAGTSG